jgi:uncharacterized membrane protein (UPF0127 family)
MGPQTQTNSHSAKRLRLLNETKNGVQVASHVELATSFVSRSVGLLGRARLPEGDALWIQGTKLVACNSIHTFFMRFAIDVLFVDRNLKVKKVYRDLRPWRMTWPVGSAFSVFELPAGTLKSISVEVGDQLHVGD